MTATNWRAALPALSSPSLVLREPVVEDAGALVGLLSLGDASGFALDRPVTQRAAEEFISRAQRDRHDGLSFTFVVLLAEARALVGLVQVRRLDPAFEGAEWEATLAPFARGTGVFAEASRLIGSFAFGPVGVHRLEARVLLQNGRANSALRKIGAVQEGILRRSARRGDDYVDQVLWSMLREDWKGDAHAPTSPRIH